MGISGYYNNITVDTLLAWANMLTTRCHCILAERTSVQCVSFYLHPQTVSDSVFKTEN